MPMSRGSNRGQPDEPPLSTDEIEAILLAEGSSAPEADRPGPEFHLVRREPGESAFGRWVTWLVIAFILLGLIGVLR
jgi:hypothetical protein